MVPLYIGSKRTISTYITEESSNNNSHMILFLLWKLFVSTVETVCFSHGNKMFPQRNIWKQTDYLILRYVIVVTILRLFSMNV